MAEAHSNLANALRELGDVQGSMGQVNSVNNHASRRDRRN